MIPLNHAVLCVDCDGITRGANNCCEICGSKALLRLAAILNRDEIPSSKPQHIYVQAGAA